MRELDGRRLRTRVKGKDSLLRRLRSLLIATGRFDRCRVRTDEDRRFIAKLTDGLQATLRAVDPHQTERHHD